MKVRVNTIYKSSDGEYFECVDKEGTLKVIDSTPPVVQEMKEGK